MAENTEGNTSQAFHEPQAQTSALDSLDPLVGAWAMEGSHPFYPEARVSGHATFEWLKGKSFLVQRWDVDNADFPGGIAIIGYDEPTGNFTVRYFDSRGVARLYYMSLHDGIWREWREDPGFSQRFSGTFADNGNTIMGRWEKSVDGATWEHDFDLTYRKVA
jgi:hypothetical protein